MASATVPVGCAEGIEGTHTYTYDALGRRVGKSVDDGGTTTMTVFINVIQPLKFSAHAGQIVGEYAAGTTASVPVRSFVYGTYIDEPVLLIDSPGALAQHYHFHSNSSYSISVVTNGAASAVERYQYTSYGTVQIYDADAASYRTDSIVNNAFGFVGRQRDRETGLLYYRARYLDSKLGRLTNRDPIGLIGSRWNLFEYVASNPFRYLDPSGMIGPGGGGDTGPPHNPGGPIELPEDRVNKCKGTDSCPVLEGKMRSFIIVISSHQIWDAANPDPRWPCGRHCDEIADFVNGLKHCYQIYTDNGCRKP